MISSAPIQIGWAEADITPLQPTLLAGQFCARLSEGVRDPLKATALVLQSTGDHVVFVSCDLISIADPLRDAVREKVARNVPEMDVHKIILNATHTHDAPETRAAGNTSAHAGANGSGVELEAQDVGEYVCFAAEQIFQAIVQAWETRADGGVAFGQSYAVLARNRRWVNKNGTATMHGLNHSTADTFDFIEGFEDHSVNLLATYDAAGVLTGILLNTPCTAQATDSLFEVSADFWQEARQELRARFGEKLFILPQVSAAGDLTPIQIYDQAADQRMLKLRNRTLRQELALRLADAVSEILPYIASTASIEPELQHVVKTVELPVNALSEKHATESAIEAEQWQLEYEAELQKLRDNPELKNQPRWYVPASAAYRKMNWFAGVQTRFEEQQVLPTKAAELHVVRLGEVVFATNPFEYYLDFGIQIKVQSPATQTFLVELCGPGTYVPSARSVRNGGYGSMPASNPIGVEGGQAISTWTTQNIRALWQNKLTQNESAI